MVHRSMSARDAKQDGVVVARNDDVVSERGFLTSQDIIVLPLSFKTLFRFD